MKQFLPLLCLVLVAAPLGTAKAEGMSALAVHEDARLVQIGHVPKKGEGRERDNRDSGGGNRGNNGGGRPDRGGDRGYENRRDDRINRAMSIASSRGRVLDAGPQSGSIFWVRVATENGRVDLLVDTDSGRIIGER